MATAAGGEGGGGEGGASGTPFELSAAACWVDCDGSVVAGAGAGAGTVA